MSFVIWSSNRVFDLFIFLPLALTATCAVYSRPFPTTHIALTNKQKVKVSSDHQVPQAAAVIDTGSLTFLDENRAFLSHTCQWGGRKHLEYIRHARNTFVLPPQTFGSQPRPRLSISLAKSYSRCRRTNGSDHRRGNTPSTRLSTMARRNNHLACRKNLAR
jgi:hypothetical protein